jgi:MYXO-CTERM domain-containing protein
MTKISYKKAAIIAASAFAFVPGAAIAQNATDSTINGTTGTDYTTVQRDTTTVQKEDHDFPWGLLGLLGLAGLLGRKRKESDIHVDARRDTRP